MALQVSNFSLSDQAVAEFCQRWQVQTLALFGSVLRPDYSPNSDIDILITFSPIAKRGLLTLAKMKHELEDMTGRKVDLVVRQSVLDSANWLRRQHILNSAQVIYEAR
ncbi:nucleotidyltransferase family protein [Leptolyngbya sp. PCC 6406]|uniref:nucleotidyltransferase family protein n=1 Tax=Leptolyngbya sp. PCC 6406 TaxID=1173264 RepID=UPI0002AC94F7|nr:nucleotidyltransferase domain-containing protein [Leptolyngbya sp. PCC 6406]